MQEIANNVLGGYGALQGSAVFDDDVGAGVAIEGLTATAELSYAQVLGVPGPGRDDWATAGASLRYTLSQVAPYVMVSSPLVDYRSNYFRSRPGSRRCCNDRWRRRRWNRDMLFVGAVSD